MIGSLPPWLQISPRDYLLATQAGVQAGHAIAESTQRAWEQEQQMRMAEERQKNVLAQQAIENAQVRLAADRLEQYRQSEIENRKAERDLQAKGLDIRSVYDRGLIENARNRLEDLNAQRDFKNDFLERTQKWREDQAKVNNDYKQDVMDLRKQIADTNAERPRQAHFFTGPDNKQYMVRPGDTNAIPVGLPSPSGATTGESGSIMPNLLSAGKGLSALAIGANPVLHALGPLASLSAMRVGSDESTPEEPKRFKYNPQSGALEPADINPETQE